MVGSEAVCSEASAADGCGATAAPIARWAQAREEALRDFARSEEELQADREGEPRALLLKEGEGEVERVTRAEREAWLALEVKETRADMV